MKDVLNMMQSIFAWNETNEHTSLTSQKALQPPDIDLHAKQNKYLSLKNNVGEEIVDVLHDGMESVCDLDPSIADLQILELKAKLSEAQNKLERSFFRLEHITGIWDMRACTIRREYVPRRGGVKSGAVGQVMFCFRCLSHVG